MELNTQSSTDRAFQYEPTGQEQKMAHQFEQLHSPTSLAERFLETTCKTEVSKTIQGMDMSKDKGEEEAGGGNGKEGKETRKKESHYR